MFGGQPDILKCLSNLQVNAPATFKTNEKARRFTIYYTKNKPITLRYDIIDTVTAKKDIRQELFRPMISDDYFYCHGVNLFLNPQPINKELKPVLSVKWEKGPGFPLFYGFDPENAGRKKLTLPADSIMFSLLTGATDLSIDKFELHGVKNYIVLRGMGKENFNRMAVRDYFIRFNESIRKFWDDYSDPCFSLVLQPFLDPAHSASGVAYANGFIGKYKSDTIVQPDRVYVISHEIGHHWLGHKLEMNISNQWFGEGFNDYITFNTLLTAGQITPADFETRMNDVMKLHYGSTIKNTPNDSVFANYWKMGDYNKLPYRRGCLFAFYLDNQIRILSNGQKTIRDLLRNMAAFRKTKPVGYEISVDDFTREASAFIPQTNLEAVLDNYIMKGNPIPFASEMLLPVFSIGWEKEIPHIKITDEKIFRTIFL
jgi:predicted metalloprotease with PDZ domain